MANNCGACKHWEVYTPCDRTGFGECKEITDDYDIVDKTPKPLAYTHACEFANSSLLTQAEFGCILWEGRDGE